MSSSFRAKTTGQRRPHERAFAHDLEAVNQESPGAGQKRMGLILDSSIVIIAERRGDTVEKLIEQVVATANDQDALSSVGLTELTRGIFEHHQDSWPNSDSPE